MNTAPTIAAVLERAAVTVPDPALADIEVPILTGPQRQGDVAIIPIFGHTTTPTGTPVPAAGTAVVRGEATGNTHLLMPEHGHRIYWTPAARSFDGGTELGTLHVPDGAVAWLIHTDEHGVNGIGPGRYLLRGKREQANGPRRVAD